MGVTSTGVVGKKTPTQITRWKMGCYIELNELCNSLSLRFFFFPKRLKDSQSSNSTRSICSKLATGVKARGRDFPQGSVEARPQRDLRLELLQVVRPSIPSLSPEV